MGYPKRLAGLLEVLHHVDSVHHVQPVGLGVDHAVDDFGRRPRNREEAQDLDYQNLVALQLDDRLEVIGNACFVSDGIHEGFVVNIAALF